MKIRSFFAGLIMAAAAFIGCEQEEQLGMPDVTLGATDLEFTQDAGSQEMKFTATREWKVEYDADWIAVTPEGGQGSNSEQTLTVTVTENTKGNRTAKVTVTIGMVSKAFNVNQAGPEGETDGVEALTVKEFIEKADTENYYRLSGTVSGFNANYCSFDITDASGKIYVYSVTAESKAEWTDKIKNGGTVVLQGKYEFYEAKSQHEVVDAIIESFTEGQSTGGNVDTKAVYHNNYDKAEATKTYGSGESWPYLDEFEGWKNQAGTGAAGVTYAFEGMSARANSTSDSSYSDYSGSGMNNMFFGKSAYLATYNISLGSDVNFNISFGTEKYDGNDKSAKFNPDEFHVYLSNDGKKWVELDYTFAGTEAGRWNVASADFTVPSGTSKLSVCMAADKASVYRMDDLKIVVSDKAGVAIDFSKGVEKDFAAGEDSGNDDNTSVEKPASLTKVTIDEFKKKAVNETDWYELTGKITEIQKEDWGNFVIEDETGSVLIYGMTSKWVGSNDKSFSQIGLKVGDTVTLGTLRGEYNGTPQGGGNKIPAYYISHVKGEGGNDAGNDDSGSDSSDDETGEAGEYDPQGITWTLGEKAYDKTSGNNAQTGTVNGVAVNDMLKLGTGSLTGNATLHIPAGTKKVGFYLLAWKGKTATVKASVAGEEVASLSPKANDGATGNPPYTITVTSDDYYEIEVNASEAIDLDVETTDKANGRVIFIGLKAITE